MKPVTHSARRELLRRADSILEREYASPRHGNYRDPTTELFYILLTVRTRISDVPPLLRRLRRRCHRWDAILDIPDPELLTILEPLGFGQKRCSVLREVATRIRDDFGSVSLARLRRWPKEKALEYLRSLPFVGEKIARCVAMYSLDADVSPMDSNTTRVLSRIGVLPRGISPKAAHKWMDALTPPKCAYRIHVNSVAHGQMTCTARYPRCDACALQPHCRFARTGH